MPWAELPFQRGVARGDGALVADPAAFMELENWFVEAGGRLQLRPGMQTTGWPVVPWGTDVVCVVEFRERKDVLLVVYDRTSRDLRLYRVNPSGPTIQNVGTWGTLNANAPLKPPVVFAAEHSGLVFFAHSETYAYRLKTIIYTPDALDVNPGTFAALNQDLNGDGAGADVYFRGVYAWGPYMLGWGYGEETSAGSKDAPGVLRVSTPADVTDWPPGSFAQFGQYADPILCVQAGGEDSMPIVAKANELHALRGTSAADFAPVVIDQTNGLAADRAMVAAEGRVFLWSGVGPRVTDGGASVDLEFPLSLQQGLPNSLPGTYDRTYMWAVYHEDKRVVEFGLCDAAAGGTPTVSFFLCLRPNPVQWAYGSRPRALLAAGVAALDKVAPVAPTGYASAVSVADGGISPGNAGRKVTIGWTNNSAVGDETVQVFMRLAGGTWVLQTEVAVSGSTQSVSGDGFDPLTTYEAALRYVRGSAVKTGYEDPDPNNWTGATVAGAKGSGSTSCGTPVQGQPVWSEIQPNVYRIRLNWTVADLTPDILIEYQIDGGSWAQIILLPNAGGANSFDYFPPLTEASHTLGFRMTPKKVATGTTSNVKSLVNGFTVPVTFLDLFQNLSGLGLIALCQVDPLLVPPAQYLEFQSSPDGVTWTSRITMYFPTAMTTDGRMLLSLGTAAALGGISGTLQWRVRCLPQSGTLVGPWSASLTRTVQTSGLSTTLETETSPTFPAWDTTPAPRSMRFTTGQLGSAPWLRYYLRAIPLTPGRPVYITGPFTANPVYVTLPAAASGERYQFYLIRVTTTYLASYNEQVAIAGLTQSNPAP